jgi:hypothetical protein
MFWDYDPCLFQNEVDGPYYDYVLVRGAVDPFEDEPAGPAWDGFAAVACQFAASWGHPVAGSWGQGGGLNDRG